ncbi:MAG: hypothetical protein IJ538_02545 [Clostridia bacterium]|nr:hypothetical protein [Clostridia bacterium]
MKHCKLCDLEVKTTSSICPLCYSPLENVEGEETFNPWQSANDIKTEKIKFGLAFKICFFLSLIAISVSIYANVMTRTPAWSAIVGLSILYVWVLVLHTIKSRDNVFRKAFFNIGIILALLFVTNHVFGTSDWLTSYVYPSLAMLVGLALSINLIASKRRKHYVFSFFCLLLLMLIVSAIILIFKLDPFKVLNQICLIALGLLLGSYLIFAWRTILEETSKKLHL